MQTTLGAKIRALMLTIVQENADYPCVLEWVAKVLAETFDLNVAEAEKAFKVLLKNPTDDTAHSLCDSLLSFLRQRGGQRFLVTMKDARGSYKKRALGRGCA